MIELLQAFYYEYPVLVILFGVTQVAAITLFAIEEFTPYKRK